MRGIIKQIAGEILNNLKSKYSNQIRPAKLIKQTFKEKANSFWLVIRKYFFHFLTTYRLKLVLTRGVQYVMKTAQ